MIEIVVDGESHRTQQSFLGVRKVVIECDCGLKSRSISLKVATAQLVRWHLKLR